MGVAPQDVGAGLLLIGIGLGVFIIVPTIIAFFVVLIRSFVF